MRTRDLQRLQANRLIVVSERELGMRGPEQLGRFLQFYARRFVAGDRRNRFSVEVALLYRHADAEFVWMAPAAIHRVASDRDIEVLGEGIRLV